jgi:ABC-type amino acid transport substrate-binding protein
MAASLKVSLRGKALWLLGLCFGWLLFAPVSWAATLTFPQPADGDRSRYAFEFDLLRAALVASQDSRATPDDLRWSAQTMTQGRARLEVAAGKLSVVHSVATSELDRQLTPVPFSLDKGLNSQRILLTRRSLLPQLASMNSVDDLRTLRFGVLGSWSDRRFLQAHGFKTEATESFSGLFKMLSLGRSDVIMTGVLNVQQLAPMLAEASDLEWEPSLLIVLPAQMQFYTTRSPEGATLAKRLLRGLQRLQASGEFESLHSRHFGEQLSAAYGRRVFRLAP